LPNTSNDISDEPGSSPDNSTNNSLPYVISLDNSTNHILADVGKNNASGIDFLPSGNKSNPETKPANYTISKEEAINLAMPYFQDYASANNRTIKSIYTYFDYVPDYRGLRGSVSQTYPVWEITASYVGVVNYNNPETWIVGYTVSIWADTGEAYSANPQGFM
jgi:hypothetical protein